MIWGQYHALIDDFVLSGAPPVLVQVGGDTVTLGTSQQFIEANALIIVDAVAIDSEQHLVRVAAYLDGNGASDASQIVRGVIYRDGEIVAVGDPVTLVEGQPAGWVTLPFTPSGLRLPAASYRFGLHAGVTDEGGSYYLADIAGDLTVYTGLPFTDGPPAAVPGGGSHTDSLPLLFLETIAPVSVSSDVDDEYLATLPFDVAQRIFGAAGVIPSSVVTAVASWYGTEFDPAIGSVAIVRSDGPLADLVGERLLVRRRQPVVDRTVAVYVHDERTFPDSDTDADLLLSARAFLALADQAMDSLPVTVGILA